MLRIVSLFAVVLSIVAVFSHGSGEERFGVPVYGGAVLDAGETAFLRNTAGADGHFYRTRDSVEKVLAFYGKQTGLTSLGANTSGGRFLKEEGGRTVYVIIESPWQPARGGAVSTDTSICIVRE